MRDGSTSSIQSSAATNTAIASIPAQLVGSASFCSPLFIWLYSLHRPFLTKFRKRLRHAEASKRATPHPTFPLLPTPSPPPPHPLPQLKNSARREESCPAFYPNCSQLRGAWPRFNFSASYWNGISPVREV
ncbi:Hypothetical protein NTJ_02930 [Nesidiocoris tenuis]|uniref:Uncharacterized protein n=1 Tax=Nesidiocoris tenuis TaxID=355587 RepID=A0ABN7ADK9_9HEMI|nr:Hypothetical protein NTJ_02930 [Nesidiocoris tenuis]